MNVGKRLCVHCRHFEKAGPYPSSSWYDQCKRIIRYEQVRGLPVFAGDCATQREERKRPEFAEKPEYQLCGKKGRFYESLHLEGSATRVYDVPTPRLALPAPLRRWWGR